MRGWVALEEWKVRLTAAKVEVEVEAELGDCKKNNWHEHRHCSGSPSGRLTGNNIILGLVFSPIFSFFFYSFLFILCFSWNSSSYQKTRLGKLKGTPKT